MSTVNQGWLIILAKPPKNQKRNRLLPQKGSVGDENTLFQGFLGKKQNSATNYWLIKNFGRTTCPDENKSQKTDKTR